MPVRPTHGQHAKSFIERAGRMILEARQQFDSFASVALEHGIVKDEHRLSAVRGQFLDSLIRIGAQ